MGFTIADRKNILGDTIILSCDFLRMQLFLLLILSVDTKIWLNADSKIRFPEKFLSSEETRTVYLESEDFFDIMHNEKQAFISE